METNGKLHGLYFGAPLYYQSPSYSYVKTPCIFIRDDGGKAVVIFRDAERVDRVEYDRLKWMY